MPVKVRLYDEGDRRIWEESTAQNSALYHRIQ